MGRSGGRERWVLVGCGHAHLEVLRRLALRPVEPRVEITVVAPGPDHYYSGMVPGYVAGLYSRDQVAIPVDPLVRSAGALRRDGTVVRIDTVGRTLGTSDGETIEFDRVSFNIGSQSAGQRDLGAGTLGLKPISGVARVVERVAELRRMTAPRVGVVGAGAAGVELALAAQARLGPAARVTLYEAGDRILRSGGPRLRRAMEDGLKSRRVIIRKGRRVSPNEEAAEGEFRIWATAARAWPLFKEAGLPVDDRGFLLVDDSLTVHADRRFHAAGDCATMASHPKLAKAGVYAVRQGPVLDSVLRASVQGRALPTYEPQDGFLSILARGDSTATAAWRGLVWSGRSAWWLKDGIDRRFVRRYQ